MRGRLWRIVGIGPTLGKPRFAQLANFEREHLEIPRALPIHYIGFVSAMPPLLPGQIEARVIAMALSNNGGRHFPEHLYATKIEIVADAEPQDIETPHGWPLALWISRCL